jgi:GNAT superfamily N-acetyltransferase
VDTRFQKEEWFSSTMLEWGTCGKLAMGEDEGAVGFAEYAPPSLFPGTGRYPSGRCSPDAVYLAYCYVVPRYRGRSLGTHLVRAVARDLVDRGFRALEALGERDWSGGWLLPGGFLVANRFRVLRDDALVPLFRLDLRERPVPRETASAAAIEAPAPEAAI